MIIRKIPIPWKLFVDGHRLHSIALFVENEDEFKKIDLHPFIESFNLDRFKRLEKEIAVYKEALEFYAGKKAWRLHPSMDCAYELHVEDCSDLPGYASLCGGKQAREALAKGREITESKDG